MAEEVTISVEGRTGDVGGHPQAVNSTSDARTVNNTMRHQYRVLSDAEKAAMLSVKDMGASFLSVLDRECKPGRETALARTKIEEAVMWAVKGITG